MVKKTFKNSSELLKRMDTVALGAIKKTQQEFYKVVQSFVEDYYKEYNNPIEYERTYAFFNSLVKSDIVKTNSGYYCEVYFDVNQLDKYYTHDGEVVLSQILYEGLHASTSLNGTADKNGWSPYSMPYDAPYDIEGTPVMLASLEEIEKLQIMLSTFIHYFERAGFSVKVIK